LLIVISVEPCGHRPVDDAATITFWVERTQALTVLVEVAAIATHTPAATTTALIGATTRAIVRSLMPRIMLRELPWGYPSLSLRVVRATRRHSAARGGQLSGDHAEGGRQPGRLTSSD
jgi:hypothetical protein